MYIERFASIDGGLLARVEEQEFRNKDVHGRYRRVPGAVVFLAERGSSAPGPAANKTVKAVLWTIPTNYFRLYFQILQTFKIDIKKCFWTFW